jgi:DNA helicase-2/ATP-dependent DNA helicase PcrA
VPSRFLEEVPGRLMEDLGSPAWRNAGGEQGRNSRSGGRGSYEDGERHYSYEDEDQSGQSGGRSYNRAGAGGGGRSVGSGQSLDNIANFFGGRGQSPSSGAGAKVGSKFGRPKLDVPEPTGKTGLNKGVRVRHPKYGEGIIFQREGDGDDAKITVQFQQHGVKKLVEKFAQLERL